MALTDYQALIEWHCPKCGALTSEDAPVCTECGTALKPVGASAEEQSQIEDHQSEISELEKQHRREKREGDKVAKTATKTKAKTKATVKDANGKSTRGRKSTGHGKTYAPTKGSRMALVVNALKGSGAKRGDIVAAVAEHGKVEASKASSLVSQALSFLRKEKGIEVVETKSGPNKGNLRMR